ncbi:MAG: WxcM-like domain-containing protein [Kiritimatiellae bacterium]|nr:WxcM-like domain-containing protein [Kiritimatiellia bacterium]
MATIEILHGEVFKDARGQISSLNNFHFDGVKRMYLLHHPDTAVIRGWNGHQYERKWFYCVKGAFDIRLVAIDHWVNPSPHLTAEAYPLCAEESRLLCVPGGYANRIQAREPDSILMVLSDKTLEESIADSYRFDAKLWTTTE